MSLAIISGIILSDQIADILWDQMEKSISNNSNIPEEQKGEKIDGSINRGGGRDGSLGLKPVLHKFLYLLCQ